MEDFHQAQYYKLWIRVSDSPLILLMKDDEGNFIQNPTAHYGEPYYRMLAKIAMFGFVLYLAREVDGEYNKLQGMHFREFFHGQENQCSVFPWSIGYNSKEKMM